MIKKIFDNINLTCLMQERTEQGTTCKGVITMNPENGQFRFEEAMLTSRSTRNLKLYEGEFLSMVHMQNGRYQCHMRTLTASPGMNLDELASKITAELVEALRVMY